MSIRVRYTSIDGYRDTRKFKTLKGARVFAHDRVGPHPELGGTYAISRDGIGLIAVAGCTLRELFPEPE